MNSNSMTLYETEMRATVKCSFSKKLQTVLLEKAERQKKLKTRYRKAKLRQHFKLQRTYKKTLQQKTSKIF